MSTPLSPEEYAAAGGSVCPMCGSEDITIESDFDMTTTACVVQCGTCLACDATWSAIYEITGYEDLTSGEKEPTHGA